MNSRALIKGFFDSRSVSGPSAALVNHQLGSFNDFLPSHFGLPVRVKLPDLTLALYLADLSF